MHAIFFDLETTEKDFIGQIINYSFITVDKEWQQVSSLVGDIKISRLHLPHPDAILANRTDVLQLQDNKDALSEYQAMQVITKYINEVIKQSPNGKAFLIGYNSTRFDIPYLRTSLIRNGINPYFGGKLVYKDLLHLVRSQACFNPKFPRTAGKDPEVLSLTLETTAQNLKLLQGKQKHHSLADVELTVKVAEFFAKKYGADIRSADTYSAHTWQKGDIGLEYLPNYDISSDDRTATRPVMLFDDNNRYALWLRLEDYKETPTKQALSWVNKSQAAFFAKIDSKCAAEYAETAKEAKRVLKDVNLNNFFETSTCDIEQDIYRVDMSGIDRLANAVAAFQQYLTKGITLSIPEFKSKDEKVVFTRYKLANTEEKDESFLKTFKLYVQYRYGGKLQLKKIISDEEAEDNYAPEYKTLYQGIEDGLANPELSAADKDLLNSLKTFYLESDIYKVLNT